MNHDVFMIMNATSKKKPRCMFRALILRYAAQLHAKSEVLAVERRFFSSAYGSYYY
jgi:hypothetical protein